MGDVWAREDDRPWRDLVSADPVRFDRAPGDDPGRWIETHRLLDDLFRVSESGEIVEAGRASSEDVGQLATELLPHRWMLREEIPGLKRFS